MPTYEFRCNACRRKVTVTTKTYSEYDALTPTCTHCGSTDLTRLISRVAIKKSPISRMMSGGWEDDDAFDDLEDADPRTMAHVLREMSAEVGEDMGPEFEEVVDRLERGESPEEIESTMPELADDDGGDFGAADAGVTDSLPPV